ncbi:MAG: hypothetical protein A2X59_01690 [Nitrospirae bacterium GWC2_42_7]|nr:MAG: hypothetical protein A2X59_01690 [Nitrospirae bacterium GWC2_42_7]
MKPKYWQGCGEEEASVSIFFYFKALFASGDAVANDLLLNLSIPIVPFLSFIFIGEHLAAIHYVGIGISFIGVSILSFNDKFRIKQVRGVFLIMIGAVIFLALSMIIEPKNGSSSLSLRTK